MSRTSPAKTLRQSRRSRPASLPEVDPSNRRNPAGSRGEGCLFLQPRPRHLCSPKDPKGLMETTQHHQCDPGKPCLSNRTAGVHTSPLWGVVCLRILAPKCSPKLPSFLPSFLPPSSLYLLFFANISSFTIANLSSLRFVRPETIEANAASEAYSR